MSTTGLDPRVPDTKALMAKALVELREARERVRRLEDAAHAPIAIIGMSCRFPGEADSADAFRDLLWNGTDAISRVPADRWNEAAYTDADPDAAGKIVSAFGGFIDEVGRFDAEFFGVSPREAENMDPQHRLLLETTWRALEHANLPPAKLRGTDTGVFAGICTYDYAIRHLVANHAPVTAHFGTGNALSAAAGRLSYLFGFTGPALSIDTACSSSLVSVHLASQALRQGECTTAIAAGVNLMLTPHTNMSFSRARMLAADGRCKPFDAAANGYVRGEGCGVVVLKLLADAQRDGDPVLAVIRGSAVNQDGASSGLTVPNGPAQQDVIRKALANARTRPQDVAYVEAHGTGTSLGDPIEARSLSASYCQAERATPLWIGSVKSNIGHLEGAAGIASLMKTVLVLQHGAIPRSLHFSSPNPAIDWKTSQLQVADALVPWPADAPRLAAVSSFGFTGTNAHVIVEAAPPPAASSASRVEVVLPLSARDPETLTRVLRDYVARLEQPGASLADIAAVAALGRDHFAHRRAVVASSAGEAVQLLKSGQRAGRAADVALVSLATRYEAGETIDWRPVADASARARTHAPGYPFSGARHWLEEASGLLPQYLADHQVFGRALVPAAALVELVLNAGREAFGTDRLLIEGFAIDRPLAWSHDLARTIRVQSSPAGGGRIQVAVMAGADRIAGADVSRAETVESGWGIASADLAAVAVESIYAACAERGLNYGPAFRSLTAVARGDASVHAEVTLPATVSVEGSALHPSLLDGCFQATAVLYPDLPPASLYLPVRIRRLTLYRSVGSAARCDATLVAADASTAQVDLRVSDLDGQPIALVEGLELARGSAASIDAAMRIEDRPRGTHDRSGGSSTFAKAAADRSDPPVPTVDAVRQIAGAILRLPPESVDPELPLTSMGLDSLMAIELRSACSAAFQFDVPVADLIRDLSVAGIVQRIAREAAPRAASTAAADEPDELPLSHGQSALWYLHQLQPASPAYNIAFAVRVRSAADETALRARVSALVARHAQLRRVYRETEAGLRQVLTPARDVFTVISVVGASDTELHQRVVEDYRAPFDLAHGPVMRVSLFSRTADDHVLLITVHHIAADAWSLWRMMEELRADGLASPGYRYADKLNDETAFLQSSAAAAAWTYWQGELAGELPVLNLLTDKPRPVVQTLTGASVPFSLDVEESERLQAIARKEGTTLYTVLLAAFQTLLHRYTCQDDILVGCPVAGRNQAASAPAVGYFVNPVVVRARFADGQTFDARLRETRHALLNAIAHQDLPFPLIAERLGGARDPGRSPIFQAAFVMQQLQQDAAGFAALMAPADPPVQLEWGGMRLEHYLLPQQEGQFDLTLEMVHAHGACHGLLKFNTDLWHAATIERMATHFRELLRSIAEAPAAPVSRLTIVPGDERAALVAMSNGPQRAYDLQRPLHHWIEDQVRRAPDAIALEAEGQSITFAEMNRRANGVARMLRAAGVGVGDPVPIAAERSIELVIGLLGALKSGGAYVPLDPAYPPARREFMLADLSARVVLDAERIRDAAASGNDENLPYEGSPDSLAYTIYTSGSTGNPKGAQNTHRGIVNRLCWMQEAFALTPEDRVLQKTPYSFDVSVWEFFWPLMVGARLVLAKPDGHRDNRYLAALIQQAGITTLHFVPPMLHAFLDEPAAAACGSLRRVVCSGQELPAAVRTRFYEVLPGAALHNLYGPTEAAVDVTWHACRADDRRTFVPIGAPIANTSIYILDPTQAMAPIGVAGELHIGGVQVARGYLNRPELTAERFVANPFAAGESMYRTGDLARYLPDGDVEFLGRTDFQVKIRGLRVELGEIEHALTSHPDVRESIVLLREDRPGIKQLAAYVVSARTDDSALEQELRRRLDGALPSYMVPDVFVRLPAMPLTSNGKIDRKALPAPAVPVTRSRAPETAAERALASVWKGVLGIDEVGAEDNFFSLGGDSIRSTQMIARARQHGYDFTVRDVLMHPTIAALARLAPSVTLSATPPVVAADTSTTGEIPLLPMQHWFFATAGSESLRFNQGVVLESDGALQAEPLRQALDDLVARHEALRLRFPADANGRRSAILVSAAEAAVHFGSSIRSFDIEAGPMMAAELTTEGKASRLALTAHHLIVDGVSWRTLVSDLETAYRARAAGRPPVFAEAAPSYVVWTRALTTFAATAALEAESLYWLTEDWRSAGELPPAAAADASHAGAGELSFEVPAEPMSGHEAEASLLASLATAIDPEPLSLRVDMEGHGRLPIAGADGSFVIGWCAALYPVLLRFDGASASARTASVARSLADIPAGGRAFGLGRYLSPKSRLRQTLGAVPPAAILFNYLGRVDRALNASSMFSVTLPDGQAMRDDRTAPAYPLEINVTQSDRALRLSLRFDRARVSEPWLRALAERWRSALAGVATEAYPLTPMQKGILFHSLLQPESGVYVQQLVASFDGAVDEWQLRAAWDAVLDRHAVLRNAFAWKGLDQPLQQPVAGARMPWVTTDARGASRDSFETALNSFLDEDRRQGFDLTAAPLHRLRLFLRDGGGTVVWTHHHILLDGRSMFAVLNEVLETVRRTSAGATPLPAPATAFRSFVAAAALLPEAEVAGYWRGQLEPFDAPTPIPFLRRGVETDPYQPSEVTRTLSPAETAQLRSLAREAGVTLNLLTQSLLALLLSRLSGLDRVMFGATVSADLQDTNAIGLCINTIPVVAEAPATARLGDWLRERLRVQAERSAFEQAGLVDVQRCSRIAAGEPLFELLFVFENYGVDDGLRQPAAGHTLRDVRVVEQTNMPLVLSVLPGESFELRLLHDRTRYPREAAELVVEGLAGLLRAAVREGLATPLQALTRLDDRTRQQVLHEWNTTAADYPHDLRVNDLIRAQVERTPDKVAVRSGSVSLTYREVDTRARAIAATLRQRGLGAGSIVGLCIERGPDMMPALLGVLEAGAAYVPMDPSFPAERLAFMLENSGAALLLTERGVSEALRTRLGAAAPVLLLDNVGTEPPRTSPNLPEPPSTTPSADDLMFVLYTSGSTGQPKGVMIKHRSVVNLLCGMQVTPGMQASDVVLGLTTLSFDIAVVELFLPLTVGATIVLVNDTDALDAKRIIRHLDGVTVMQATPSRYRLLLEAGWQGAPGLVAITGGEAMPRDLSRAILQRCSRLWNLYAPTETTVYSIGIELGRDEGPVPIGRPLANVRAYVLDESLEPVPVGVVGELFIGGDGVAVGYRGNAQLTAERFLPDPFAGTPDARMYRTSDRARWRPDGTLDFLGRLDHQVKIRGYRVELGEIESVLATQPAVARAAVIIREDRPGDLRLIAYYTVRDGAAVDDGALREQELALREHLQARLPSYMLPAHFVRLSAIPLTPNGKVDTKALPLPQVERTAVEFAAPATPVERELAAVFAEVLGHATVPADESFFNLGGHSLLLIAVQTRIAERLGTEIEMVEFFRHPTIRDLAQLVERQRNGEATTGPLAVRSTPRTAHAGNRQSQMDLRRASRETRKKDA